MFQHTDMGLQPVSNRLARNSGCEQITGGTQRSDKNLRLTDFTGIRVNDRHGFAAKIDK